MYPSQRNNINTVNTTVHHLLLRFSHLKVKGYSHDEVLNRKPHDGVTGVLLAIRDRTMLFATRYKLANIHCTPP